MTILPLKYLVLVYHCIVTDYTKAFYIAIIDTSYCIAGTVDVEIKLVLVLASPKLNPNVSK